jgi:hypothetical protein
MTQLPVLFVLSAVVLLAACNPAPPAEVVPPTLAELPTVTSTDTPAPTSTPLERPTLPPTWTPTFTPTEPLIPPTPTLDVTVALLQHNAGTDVCREFRDLIEQNPTEVIVGGVAQVFWTPVPEAVRYEVSLYDRRGFRIFFATTEMTNYTFPADEFEGNSLYGWSVVPLNFDNVPMCPPRGAELSSRLPAAGLEVTP